MKPFSVLFKETETLEIIYNGKKISRSYRFDLCGRSKLIFTFVKTNSKFLQCINLHLSTFNGKIFLEGKEMKNKKNRFPQLIFPENLTPRTFELEVLLEEGYIGICNGTEKRIGDRLYCETFVLGSAMITEKREANKYRFYCNDTENDDDFDDLIFDLEIIKLED